MPWWPLPPLCISICWAFEEPQLLHLTGRQTVGHRAKVAWLLARGDCRRLLLMRRCRRRNWYRDDWFKQGSVIGWVVCPTAFLLLHHQPSGCAEIPVALNVSWRHYWLWSWFQRLLPFPEGRTQPHQRSQDVWYPSLYSSVTCCHRISKVFFCPGKLSNELRFYVLSGVLTVKSLEKGIVCLKQPKCKMCLCIFSLANSLIFH